MIPFQELEIGLLQCLRGQCSASATIEPTHTTAAILVQFQFRRFFRLFFIKFHGNVIFTAGYVYSKSTSFGSVDIRRKFNRKDVIINRKGPENTGTTTQYTHDHEKRSDLIFQAAFLCKKAMVENSPPMQCIRGNFQYKIAEFMRLKALHIRL